jgi:hypothetical protein
MKQLLLGTPPPAPTKFYYKNTTNLFQEYVNAFCRAEISKDRSKMSNKQKLGADASKAWKTKWKYEDLSNVRTEMVRLNFLGPRNQGIIPFESRQPLTPQPPRPAVAAVISNPQSIIPANASKQIFFNKRKSSLLTEIYGLEQSVLLLNNGDIKRNIMERYIQSYN